MMVEDKGVVLEMISFGVCEDICEGFFFYVKALREGLAGANSDFLPTVCS